MKTRTNDAAANLIFLTLTILCGGLAVFCAFGGMPVFGVINAVNAHYFASQIK